ncbi:MAG: putative hydro-lyase [Acidimicrobiaceae bacterium]|nr:putative hydro-lyase [Acidimicrobiaceae bacterium]
MASKSSAGLILHRRTADGEIEVLLVHPGGPFWARRDAHAWSIPKGEHDEAEDAETAALREFEEELGSPPPTGPRIFLGEFGQSGRKRVSAWALAADFDATHVVSNTFELEWPPRSGRIQEFPEVDKAAWWTVDATRTKLHKGQAPILDALAEALDDHGLEAGDPVAAAQRARLRIRAGEHTGPTAHLAPGCIQANLVVLPRAVASGFVAFATRNPKPCPIVEVIEHGTEAVTSAPGSDLRTDIPRYRLFADGAHADSATDATAWWRDDLVSVLLGCSFSFEAALMRAGLPVRHIEQGRNVPMYITDRACEPAWDFAGPLVVSMRPMPAELVEQARRITEAYPQAHDGPVHAGDPAGVGISDLGAPDFGDPVDVREGEVPMFWACGVTPQLAIANAAPEIAIVHEPGHMFITDLPVNPSPSHEPNSL